MTNKPNTSLVSTKSLLAATVHPDLSSVSPNADLVKAFSEMAPLTLICLTFLVGLHLANKSLEQIHRIMELLIENHR